MEIDMTRLLAVSVAILVASIAAGQDIDFGDDTSVWANDGECDDPRFAGTGSAITLIEEDRLRDATDCRQLFESGEVWLAAPEEAREPPVGGGACEIPGFGTEQLASFLDLNLSWCRLPSDMSFAMLRAHAIQAEGLRCALVSEPQHPVRRGRPNEGEHCRAVLEDGRSARSDEYRP